MQGIYQGALISGTPSDMLNGYSRDIMAFMQERKCPHWALSEVRGYKEALWKMLWHSLVFMYTMPDGTLMSSWRSRDDYYEKFGVGPRESYSRAVMSGHYYDIKGTLKPYYADYTDDLYPKKLKFSSERKPDPHTLGAVFMVLRYTITAGDKLRKETNRIVKADILFEDAQLYCKHRCAFKLGESYDPHAEQSYDYVVHKDYANYLR